MQGTGIAAAAVCLLVELFQLNARIAADPSPLMEGDIAPFEWAGKIPPADYSARDVVHRDCCCSSMPCGRALFMQCPHCSESLVPDGGLYCALSEWAGESAAPC